MSMPEINSGKQTRSSITFLILFFINFGIPSGFAQEFSIIKDCIGTGNKQGLTGDLSIDNYNPKCDFQRLLTEGNNLHAIYFVYISHKTLKVDAALGWDEATKTAQNSSQLDTLKADHSCLSSETATDCARRYHRIKLEALIKIREEFLKNNKGKADLLSDKQTIHVCSDGRFGTISSSGDNSKDCFVIGKEITKDRIFKELVELNKESKKKENQGKNIADILKVQAVEFGNNPPAPKAGDTLSSDKGITFRKSRKFDPKAVNPTLAESIHERGEKFEEAAGDTEVDNKMKKGFDEISPKLRKKIAEDQKKGQADLDAFRKLPPEKRKLKADTSTAAFQSTMDYLEKEAKEKDGVAKANARKSGSALDEKDVDLEIGVDESKMGSQHNALDGQIQKTIDDIKKNPNAL